MCRLILPRHGIVLFTNIHLINALAAYMINRVLCSCCWEFVFFNHSFSNVIIFNTLGSEELMPRCTKRLTIHVQMLSSNVRDLCFSCQCRSSFGLVFVAIDAAVGIDEYILLYHGYILVNATAAYLDQPNASAFLLLGHFI